MAKPEKDEVLNGPDSNTNTGSSHTPPSNDAAATSPKAADSKEPAAGGKNESTEKDDSSETEDELSYEKLFSEVQEEAKSWQDKYVRLHAEWDTYRRRTAEQREEEKARATEKLVESLLPAIDDFERTIDYAEKNGEKGLLDGVNAVYNKLIDILQKDGVSIINPNGEAFDALECQAVATVDNDKVFDETVSEVYQKGYKMGNKVIRPAMVTVSTGGPKRPTEEE